jgi:dTDP-4-amino-4,6-dideoxygalactose transaminase
MEQTLSEPSVAVPAHSATLLVNDLSRHVGPLLVEITESLSRVVSSGWFVLGREVRAFEDEFAAYLDVPHCVGVASGSDALELALRAVGVTGGDRVLTVANAGGYASLAVLAIGATPVYVDVDPRTLLIAPAEFERALACCREDRLPRAVVVTHLYGQVADVAALGEIAQRFGVAVVEDCAQAHGASLDGRRCGGLADAAAFSFYPTKNLGALGDGGAVTTRHAAVAGRVLALRQYGWSAKYRADEPGGRNSRLDEMQAAVLRVLLPRLDSWNERRRAIAALYREGLAGHPRLSPIGADRTGDVSHLFVVRTPEREGLQRALADEGISTDVHYPVPDYDQPAVRAQLGRAAPTEPLPVTAAASRDVLTLPCFPELQDAEVVRVSAAVARW